VGDPIELAIKITGEGRYDKIEPPVLSDIPELAENFTINNSQQPGDIQTDGILFKQIIRPRHEKIARIPSIRFSYFDPQLGEYRTIESKAVPIKVLATEHVKKEDIVVPGETDRKGIQPFARESKGIYANYVFEDALMPHTLHWGWVLLLLLPPASYFGILISVSHRQKLQDNVPLVRSKLAKKIGSQKMKHAKNLLEIDSDEFLLELSQALKGYVSDKLNLRAGEVTTIDIKRLGEKGKLPESLAEQLIASLDKLDRRRFMGQKGSQKERIELFHMISDLIRTMENEIR
jgi:hypothetical protein